MRSGLRRLLPVLLLLATALPARADMDDIAAFFGRYEGRGIELELGVVAQRAMTVEIGPTDDGFNVTWTTTTFGSGRGDHTKRYSVNFTDTRRENIFASQMRMNKFGGRVPLDPLKGDPLIWARLIDATLTVYAMRITAEGSYDLQVYNRTRVDGGLRLAYSRFLEGEAVRTVDGFLKKVSP